MSSGMYQPELYSQNLDPVIDLVKAMIQKHGKLLRWSSQSESILDLGIGDGKMTKENILPIIPRNIKEYIGADVSEVMLKSARSTITHDKFNTVILDAVTKDLSQELKSRFHHVFSILLLHRIPNIRDVFTNINDMLKPGGQVFFVTFGKTYADEVFEKLDAGKWNEYKHSEFISPFHKSKDPAKEYADIIKSLGFVDCYIFVDKYTLSFTETSLEEFIISVSTPLTSVKPVDRVAYLEDYIRESKNSSMVNLIGNMQYGEKIYEMPHDVITGIISKPS